MAKRFHLVLNIYVNGYLYIYDLVSSAATGKKTKPLYKRKPPLICVRAFQNGNRDNYARITVPDLQQVYFIDLSMA